MGCSGSKEKQAPPPKEVESEKKIAGDVATIKKSESKADEVDDAPLQALQAGTTQTLKTTVNPLKNAIAASKQAESSAGSQAVAEKHLSKEHGSRLQVQVQVPIAAVSKFEEQEKNKAKSEKIFEAPKGPEKSKIWQALNPTQIAYQSRREKEEDAQGEKWSVEIRGGGKSGGGVSYQKMTDENGNLVDVLDDEEEEEEEEVDVKSLPNFGEFQAEMDAKRQERQKKLEEKQNELRRSYTQKKEAEQAIIDKEMALIKAKADAERKKKQEEEDRMFKEVQVRLNDQSQFQFDFKFQ